MDWNRYAINIQEIKRLTDFRVRINCLVAAYGSSFMLIVEFEAPRTIIVLNGRNIPEGVKEIFGEYLMKIFIPK